jgi:hypothetical protein
MLSTRSTLQVYTPVPIHQFKTAQNPITTYTDLQVTSLENDRGTNYRAQDIWKAKCNENMWTRKENAGK